MKYINLIISVLFINSLSAQYSENDNTVVFNYDIDYKVELDTAITENKNHELCEYIVNQGEDYIEWIYRLNEQRNKSLEDSNPKTNEIANNNGANSLIFTLSEDGDIRYDTLANMVDINIGSKPKKIGFFRKLWNKISLPNVSKIIDEQNIEGSLPKGCMSWVNVSRKRLKCGVEIVQPLSVVSMVLKNWKGEVIHTFVDGNLYRGWNNYEWNRGEHKKGTYILSITVDGSSMTQNVTFE